MRICAIHRAILKTAHAHGFAGVITTTPLNHEPYRAQPIRNKNTEVVPDCCGIDRSIPDHALNRNLRLANSRIKKTNLMPLRRQSFFSPRNLSDEKVA